MPHNGTAPATLLLASLSLPSARQLASAAINRKWKVRTLDEAPCGNVHGRCTFYGGTDRAAEYAARFQLSLIEPPLDLLARLPPVLLGRRVRFGMLSEMSSIQGPIFVKPADPILKSFDAGVYRSVAEVRGRRPIPGDTPVIVSEPVEWTSEFRCFICNGSIQAWSPYLSYGRPVWKPGSAGSKIPANITAFVKRLTRLMHPLPPAFVVDIGVLEDGRWAVVEFNPAWCSGILGANVEAVLNVIQQAAVSAKLASPEDRQWARLPSQVSLA
jgi:hypothetical protein